MTATSPSPSVRVIGSAFIPEGYVALCDAQGATICLIMMAPHYRVLSGDPMDERICATKVSMSALARYAEHQVYREYLCELDEGRMIRQ